MKKISGNDFVQSITLVIVLCILGLAAAWFLDAVKDVSTPSPAISHPEELRQDATKLCKELSGEVPESAWPNSVKALHPRFVYAYHKLIYVTISGGGISAMPFGYIIWSGTVKRAGEGIEKFRARHDGGETIWSGTFMRIKKPGEALDEQ